MNSARHTKEAAALIEQLLADPQLRATFRRDPVSTCEQLGFQMVADELGGDGTRVSETLDLRESKSSLAGLLMAAAVEGLGAWQLIEHARREGGTVGDVATHVSLPAIRPHDTASAPPAEHHHPARGRAGAGSSATDVRSPAPAAARPDASASGRPAAQAASAPATPASAHHNSTPATAAAPAPASASPSDGVAATTPASTSPVATTPDTAVPTTPAADAGPALHLDATAQAAVDSGAIPKRAIRALEHLATRYDLAVTVSPTSPADLDITAVDGSSVGESNMAARDVAARLAALPERVRPSTIATPWQLSGDRFVHDRSLDDRLRISFGPRATRERADASLAVTSISSTSSDGTATAPAPVDAGTTSAPADAPAATSPVASSPSPADTAPAMVSTPSSIEPVLASTSAPAEAAGQTADSGGDDLQLGVAQEPDEKTDSDGLRLPAAATTPPDEPAAPAAIADAAPVTPLAPDDYPGDSAPRSAIAAWMAAQAERRGLPPELPVMASLVESGMQNLSGGDRDSVGLFQMRVGIWNTGLYEGFPDHPDLQLAWFLDHAEAVRNQRVAAGLPIDDPTQYGTWIADVERPAAEYRGRYQLRFDEARALLGGQDPSAATAPATATPAAVLTDGVAGGAQSAADALLNNPHVHLDSVGRADVRDGKMDPRTIAMLNYLSRDHDLVISCTRSDHPEFTAGGSVSNHFRGRAFDIATVDGQTVNGSSPAARALAEQLSSLPEALRPDEIGSPWAIAGPGYFTDADHQDHLHVGFKTELPGGWQDTSVAPAPVDLAAAAAIAADPAAASAAAGAGADDLQLPVDAAQARRAGVPLDGGPDDSAGADGLVLPAAATTDPSAPLTAAADPSTTPPAALPDAAAATAPATAPVDAAASTTPADASSLAGATDTAAAAADAATGAGGVALRAALAQIGTPYLWGGSTPATGFDCSGLSQWAYAQAGIQLPRVAADQFADPSAAAVDRDQVQAGDLVFFRDDAGTIHHMGIALDHDRFVHAPHTGDHVKVSSLTEAYYAGQFAGARRPGAAAAGGVPEVASSSLSPATPTSAAGAPNAEASTDAIAADGKPADTDGLALPQSAAAAERAGLEPQTAAEQASGDDLVLPFQHDPVQPPEPDAAPSPTPTPSAVSAEPVITAAEQVPAPTGAEQRQMAQWLAQEAERRGLPPELPVMAALVESQLQNLPGGDRDSVGLFQMRTSIWDTGEYAGYGSDITLQAKWFLDHAEALRTARQAAGDTTFGEDPSTWGAWIADIERPAEAYRGRYQLRLDAARELLADRPESVSPPS